MSVESRFGVKIGNRFPPAIVAWIAVAVLVGCGEDDAAGSGDATAAAETTTGDATGSETTSGDAASGDDGSDAATDASRGGVDGAAATSCAIHLDCKQLGSLCVDGTCTAVLPCASDKECIGNGAVCSPELGVCVECVATADCPSDTSCSAYSCQPPAVACESSKDCAALGKVCDKVAGACVDCAAPEDCAAGAVCLQRTCVIPACVEGEATCVDAVTQRSCRADGLGFRVDACKSGELCVAGSCKATVCAPGSKRCEPTGGGIQLCDASGTGWGVAAACPTGEVCADGVCAKAACAPGTTACQGSQLASCKSDGSGWSTAPCPSGESCAALSGGAACAKQVCTPGATQCAGEQVQACDANGLQWNAGDDCSKPGPDGKAQLCVAGVCQPAVCTEGATSCGAAGALLTCKAGAWTTGSCGSGKTCVSGSCVTQSCVPGTKACGGDTTVVCNATGTDFEVVADCTQAGDACGLGACKDGVCTMTAVDCDDGQACTKDGCDAAKGCTHAAAEGPCDDGDACTVGDACSSGACVAGTGAPDCDDGEACTTDSCEKAKGCQHDASKQEGQACAAVALGKCKAGKCVAACGIGYEVVEIDVDGVKQSACAALGPVWGNRPDKPVGVYSVQDVGGEKVVLDSQTKLMWQQSTAPVPKNWADAKAYCDGLAYAGHKDWRLPSVYELVSLVAFSLAKGLVAIDTATYPATKPKLYWTSMSKATSGIANSAWAVSFERGQIATAAFSSLVEVRCVRTTAVLEQAERYQVSAGGGVVVDTWTKLQWQREPVKPNMKLEHAKMFCAALNLEGQSGWRLPWVRELHGLVDYTKYGPTLDPMVFPATPVTEFGTASPFWQPPLDYFSVSLFTGATGTLPPDVPYLFRCVRGG